MILIDRYGREIEADFHANYGVDVLDFFRGQHTWKKFWRLLSQLSADSRYIKAQQDDPALAEVIAAEQIAEEIEAEKKGVVLDNKWRPTPADWTLDRELLAEIRDRLGEVAALLADLPTAVKTRHKSPPQFPRPETELDKARIRHRKAYEEHEQERIMSEVDRAKARYRAMVAAEQEANDGIST